MIQPAGSRLERILGFVLYLYLIGVGAMVTLTVRFSNTTATYRSFVSPAFQDRTCTCRFGLAKRTLDSFCTDTEGSAQRFFPHLLGRWCCFVRNTIGPLCSSSDSTLSRSKVELCRNSAASFVSRQCPVGCCQLLRRKIDSKISKATEQSFITRHLVPLRKVVLIGSAAMSFSLKKNLSCLSLLASL